MHDDNSGTSVDEEVGGGYSKELEDELTQAVNKCGHALMDIIIPIVNNLSPEVPKVDIAISLIVGANMAILKQMPTSMGALETECKDIEAYIVNKYIAALMVGLRTYGLLPAELMAFDALATEVTDAIDKVSQVAGVIKKERESTTH